LIAGHIYPTHIAAKVTGHTKPIVIVIVIVIITVIVGESRPSCMTTAANTTVSGGCCGDIAGLAKSYCAKAGAGGIRMYKVIFVFGNI
jgi:hypothetical protein